MKTEKQLRDFLSACGAVRDWGMSKGLCPMDANGNKGCCAECSAPSAVKWVLDECEDGSTNGQDALIDMLKDEETKWL
jgi:hypothetical protein